MVVLVVIVHCVQTISVYHSLSVPSVAKIRQLADFPLSGGRVLVVVVVVVVVAGY